MPPLKGFPPIARADATVLILGSMPGRRSLEAQQYYAQSQNSFWKIMGTLFGAGPELTYAQRRRALTTQRIALWDVLQACERKGSLDSAIEIATAVPNDLAEFFGTHRGIRQVFFNGQMAARLYARWMPPVSAPCIGAMRYTTLPSTSPAHATLNFERKLGAWRALRDAVRAPDGHRPASIYLP